MNEQIAALVQQAREIGATEDDLSKILDNRPDLRQENAVGAYEMEGPPVVSPEGEQYTLPEEASIAYGEEFDTPPSDISPTPPVATGDTPEDIGIDTPTPPPTPEDGSREPLPGHRPAPVSVPTNYEYNSKPHQIPEGGQMFVPGMPEQPEDLDVDWLTSVVNGFMKYNPVTALSVQAQDYVSSILDGERYDPNYKPYDNMDALAGYPYELFVNSGSAAETERIKRQYDRDWTIDQQMSRTGFEGTAGAILGGATNPLYIFPFLGIGGRAGRLMYNSTAQRMLPLKTRDAIYTNLRKLNLSQGFKRGSIEGLTGEALTEAIYHGLDADLRRTIDESAFNMTAGAVAGGALNWLLKSRAITPEDMEKIITKLEVEHKNIGAISDAQPIKSLADEPEIDQLTGVQKLLAKITPIRVLASDNPLSRKLGALIGEQNVVNTTRAAVETRIRKYDGALFTGLTKMREQYKLMQGRGHRMSYDDFGVEVTHALRNGDVHPNIPEAEVAAKHLRREVLDPMEKAAIDSGFLKEGWQPNQFARSYFPRQYNFAKIDQERSLFIRDIADWLQGQFPDFKRVDLEDAARDMIRQITDGSQTEKTFAGEFKFTASSLKGRTVPVPDNVLKKYLINEPDSVLRSWSHDLATHMEMHSTFGSTDLAKELDEVAKKWDEMIEVASKEGNEKLVARYSKQKDGDLEVLAALRDRLLNRYKLPDNPRSFFVRAGRVARNLNILRLLGGMTLSAFPDMARPLYHHGFRQYAKAVSAVATSPELRKMAKADLRRMGVGTEMVLHGRLRSIAEMDYMPQRLSKFEFGLEKLVSGRAGGQWDFGKMSLMSHWNTGMKDITGLMSQDGLIHHLSQNVKFAKKLRQAGISDDMVKRMKEQLKEHGTSVEGLRFGNTDKWADLEAAELFESTILREVDATIITPGIMDKPLWMSSEMGKVLGQLKSFGFAATNKQFLAGLNNFDGMFIQGNLVAITLGAMTYMIKRTLAGQEPDLSPEELLMKGIEYSGVIGIGSEAIQFGAGMANASGLYKGDGNWRWARQGMWGTIGGPAAGLMEDTLRAPRVFTKDQPNAGDVEALRRLMPYQNLFYISPLFKKAEDMTKDRLNIVE